MRKRIICLLAAVCLLLGGCSVWPDGHYVSVRDHADERLQQEQRITSVKNYNQLLAAVKNLVESGKEKLTLSVENYNELLLKPELMKAIHTVCNDTPIGAYAVENISYEIGLTGGVSAVSLTVNYNNNQSKISRMRHVSSMRAASDAIEDALDACASELVIRVSGYQEWDFVQLAWDHAAQNPDLVMEIPQLTVNVYPRTGSYRVLEVLFTYQSSRESLKSMQSYVQPIFASSVLYVSGEESESSRYDMLCSFLMERNVYRLETSLTPAYTLLRHGVGDSRAFAIVYEAMCKRAGLECMTVSGTREGEQWYWNIICEDGAYYHLDLVESHRQGSYKRRVDSDMDGYVWDYSAYPECVVQVPPETTPPLEPTTTVPEHTGPAVETAQGTQPDGMPQSQEAQTAGSGQDIPGTQPSQTP